MKIILISLLLLTSTPVFAGYCNTQCYDNGGGSYSCSTYCS